MPQNALLLPSSNVLGQVSLFVCLLCFCVCLFICNKYVWPKKGGFQVKLEVGVSSEGGLLISQVLSEFFYAGQRLSGYIIVVALSTPRFMQCNYRTSAATWRVSPKVLGLS